MVLKVYSHTITHKTDVGGVKLDLIGEAAVRAAYREIEEAVRARGRFDDFVGVVVQPMIARDGYELILGSSIDPQFGPVLLFGAGGQLVEVFRDRALGLPPLNRTLARRMMERTRFTAPCRACADARQSISVRWKNCSSDSASLSWSNRASRRSTSIRCSHRRNGSSRWTRE